MSVISGKKKLITDHICKVMNIMDPSGHNGKVWRNKLDSFNDTEFDFFMGCLRDEKEILFMETPNMKIGLKYANIKAAANYVGVDFFHHLKMIDPTTGVEFVTNQKYMILEIPVRRMQQTIHEKMSIPIDDKKIDGMTGQVSGDDRACSITYPEIQAYKAQGLSEVLSELVTVRGGNISAYAKMRQDLEELGEADISTVLDPNSAARSTVMLDVLITSMGYETNLTER